MKKNSSTCLPSACPPRLLFNFGPRSALDPEETMTPAQLDYASPRTGDSAVVETLTLAPSFFYE